MKLCPLFARTGCAILLAISFSFMAEPSFAKEDTCPSSSGDVSAYAPIYSVVCEFKTPGSHLNSVFNSYANPTFQQAFTNKVAKSSYAAVLPNDIQTCNELGGQAILRQNEINVNYQQLVVDYGKLLFALNIAKSNPTGTSSGAQSSLVGYDTGSSTYQFKGDQGSILADMNVKKDAIDLDVLELFKISTVMDSPIQGGHLPNCYPSALSTQVNPYWDVKTGTNSDVTGPLNVFLSHLSGFNSDYGYYYQKPANLAEFFTTSLATEPTDPDPSNITWTNYTNLQAFTQDYALLYKIPQFTPNETFDQLTKSSTLQNLAAAGTGIQNSSTTSAPDRCGNGHSEGLQGVFGISTLDYDFCVIVDYTSQFADSLLLSAGELLAYTASIPHATPQDIHLPSGSYFAANVPQSFWGSALPSDVKTPFQTLMVNQDSDVGQTVFSTQKILSKLLDILIVLVFLVIAIANILQIQLNTYGLRKLVPGLLIGLILSQASFFMVRAALEVVGQVSNGIISLATLDSKYQGASVIQNYVETFSKVRGPDGATCLTAVNNSPGAALNTAGNCDSGSIIDNGAVFQQAILNLFVFAGAIMIFILGFQFGIRVVIFTIAVPLAPIAVFSRFFPPLTSIIWARWSKTVFNWILMPIPAVGLLLISSLYFNAVNARGATATPNLSLAHGHLLAAVATSTTNNFFGYMLNYIAGIFFLYSAIKIPLSMAGDGKAVLDKFNALGKFGYNQAGGQALKNQYAVVAGGVKARSDAMGKSAGMASPLGRAAQKVGGVLHKDADARNDMSKALEARAHNDVKELWDSNKGTGIKYLLGHKNVFNQKEIGLEALRMQTKQDIVKGEHDAHDADFVSEEKKRIAEANGGALLEIMAKTESIKESTGQLDDIFKSEIKMRKENLLEEKEEYHRLRAKQTTAKRDAETAETKKELSYRGDKYKDIVTGKAGYYNEDVQFAEIESEVQGEVRTKAAEQAQRSATLKISQTTGSLDSLDTIFKKFASGKGDATDNLVAVEHAKIIRKDVRYKEVLEKSGFKLEDELKAAGTDTAKLAVVQSKFNKIIREGFEKGSIDGKLSAATNTRVRNKDKSIIVEQAKADVDNGDMASNINVTIDPNKEAKEVGSSDIYKQARILGGLGGTIIDPGNDKNIQTWTGGSLAMHSSTANNSSEISAIHGIIQGVMGLSHTGDALTDAAIDKANDNIDAASAAIVNLGDTSIKLRDGGPSIALKFASGKNNQGGGLTEFFRVLKEDVTDPRDRKRIIDMVENTGALDHIYLDKGTAGNPTKLKTSRNVNTP